VVTTATLLLGLPVLGFLIHRWRAVLLAPIAWLLLYLADEQGWWGAGGTGESGLAIATGLAVLNMLTTTVGVLLGQIYADRTAQPAARSDP